jgi:hypothetical protein
VSYRPADSIEALLGLAETLVETIMPDPQTFPDGRRFLHPLLVAAERPTVE